MTAFPTTAVDQLLTDGPEAQCDAEADRARFIPWRYRRCHDRARWILTITCPQAHTVVALLCPDHADRARQRITDGPPPCVEHGCDVTAGLVAL